VEFPEVGTCFCLLALLFVPCPAQEPDLTISGTVVNSVTGEPIRQALVSVILAPNRREASGPQNAPLARSRAIDPVLTDSSGAFQVRGLLPGWVTVRAQKPGFTAASENLQQLDASRDGLTIRLSPLGSISGRVLDAEGEPVPGVAIRAFESRIQDGRRELSSSRSVSTDDLGRYHLWNVAPRSYYILAAGRRGGTATIVGQPPSLPSAHEGFAPVYYPAAADRASATSIAITPGQAFQADLRVAIEPAFRVRGLVRNHDRSRPVTIEAFRAGLTVSASRAVVNPASGRFEISDLVPGSYVIRATQGAAGMDPDEDFAAPRAQREIQIGGSDVEGVALDLAPGVDVKAIVRSPVLPDDAQPRRRRSGPAVSIELIEVGPTETIIPSAGAASDGTLIVPGVPPGQYRLKIECFGLYVASAIAGGQDLLQGAPLSVGPGSSPPAIEIVLRDDGGTVSGTVATGKAATANLWALLAPVAAGSNFLKVSVPRGAFEFRNVAPGDYQAYLLNSLDTVEYRNPEVLRVLRGGRSVHVTAGGTTSVVLEEVAQ
jgi:protocatechuate 3,4-dioxygenase beta subunit